MAMGMLPACPSVSASFVCPSGIWNCIGYCGAELRFGSEMRMGVSCRTTTTTRSGDHRSRDRAWSAVSVWRGVECSAAQDSGVEIECFEDLSSHGHGGPFRE